MVCTSHDVEINSLRVTNGRSSDRAVATMRRSEGSASCERSMRCHARHTSKSMGRCGFAAGVRLAYEKMRTYLEEVAERAASTGHFGWSAWGHNGLAGVALIEGRYPACLDYVETALGYAGDDDAVVWLVHGMAASAP
jgi:hypothetical protein